MEGLQHRGVRNNPKGGKLLIQARFLFALTVMLTGCQRSAPVSVENAWVRLSPVADGPASAYFILHGGDKNETLASITAPDAARVEMREHTSHSGIEDVVKLKTVTIPARSVVRFSVGGMRAMLYGLKSTITVGTSTPLIFNFADGRKVTVNGRVIAPGSPEPKD